MKTSARFVFVTLLADWLVVFLISPVFPKLMVNLAGGQIARASAVASGIGLLFAVTQFFAAPILGLVSDRFGRKPVIVLSNLGTCIDTAIMGLAPNLWWLFVGRVLSGATTAGTAAAAAYIADRSTPETRAQAFGMIGAAFGIGFAVGPAVGGLLAGFGTRVPFFAASAVMLASAAYAAFFLPESLDPEKRSASFAWARANPLGSLKLIRRHRELSGLVGSLFCSTLAVQSFSVLVFYTIFRFGWGDRANGFALATFGALSVVSSMVVGRLTKRFGSRTVVASGYALGTCGFLAFAFAPNGPLFAIGLVLCGCWAVAGPPMQAAISQRVAPTEQGELQGALASARSIGMIVGPSSFGLLFAYVSAHGSYPWYGAPWIGGAALLVGATILALRTLPARAEAMPRPSATPA